MTTTIDLDKTTPKWPEALVDLTARRITIGGITTTLASTDLKTEAVELVARQATAHGHPIRVKATTADGWVQRMIVTADRQVVLVGKKTDPPVSTTAPDRKGRRKAEGKHGPKAVDAPGPANPIRKVTATVPRWMRFVFIGVAVVMVAGIAVIALAGGKGKAAGSSSPAGVSEVPPAGTIYTEQVPAGWSNHAAWTVPIAPKAPAPVTDPATGNTALIEGTRDELFLRLRDQDGRALWTAPLDRMPTYGPTLVTVNGQTRVLITERDTLTYWSAVQSPGDPAVIDLPRGTKIAGGNPGPNPLFLIGKGTAGYLDDGQLRTVEVLPLTQALATFDGGVLMWQDNLHTWWKVTADEPPHRFVPAPGFNATVNPPDPPRTRGATGLVTVVGHGPAHLMVMSSGDLYALTRAG